MQSIFSYSDAFCATLDPGSVHLWWVDLAGLAKMSGSLLPTLSASEAERASRFVFDRDRQAYIVSHAALRNVLGRYLLRDPAELNFITGEHGKPHLDGAGVEFNLSHSKGLALIGVASQTVGVDVECVGRTQDCLTLAQRFFHPQEYLALSTLTDPLAQQRHFTQIWSAKESYIKALGMGLIAPLSDFNILINNDNDLIFGAGVAADEWAIKGFSLLHDGQEYRAAVTASTLSQGIQVRRWSPSKSSAPAG